LHMPDCNGIEATRVIRQDPQYASLPIVFLTTESGLMQQKLAFQTGADDFLRKPISDGELVFAVSIRAERFRALTALVRQDSMTGLYNHLSFKTRLDTEIDRSRRSGKPLSVTMLDIDHFKRVNDTHGHPQGDRVIKTLAQLLRKRLRKSDIIGRYGGEEFAVAMPDTPVELAATILNELREQFCQLRYMTEHADFACSFSAGVSLCKAQDNVASVLKTADQALYHAKETGINRVQCLD
jgi:diguanylate cyclase (GGDEF)-like protein